MFYVERVPWHGLGVQLHKPPTVLEAIQTADLDWTVSTHQMSYTPPGVEKPIPSPRYAVIRNTDHQYLGAVGSGWTPLQNVDAFQWFQPFIDQGLVTLETAGSLRRGKHVWILARIKGDPLQIADGDNVERFLLLANGHDGTMAAWMALTPIRVVCANTLAMSQEAGETKMLRVFHTGSVKENVEKVRETIDVVNNRFVATAELYRDLAKRAINTDDLEKYIQRVFIPKKKLKQATTDLIEIGATSRPGARLIEDITPIFEKGRGNDIPSIKGSWWAAYNSVSEYLAHCRGTSQDVRMDSLWFGGSAVANKKALDIAKDMAFA